MNTAPGGNQPAQRAQPQTETTNLSGATIPQQATENLQGLPVTSLKRGGLLGVVDSIADVLAGKQRPELGKDADGNLYVKQHDLTRGEQWMRIAGEAIHGAAAGLAAGKGAGNMGKAPLAGIEAGQQDRAEEKQNEQEMNAQVDKQKLANANNQMLQMKMAENAWTLANNKTKAAQEDIKFYNEQEDRLIRDGGKVIGTAAHPGDIAEILKVQPDVFEQMIKKQTVRILPNIDADGNHLGIKAIIMPTGYHNELLPAGAEGHMFNPVTGQIETFNYSDPVTAGERDVHDAAAMTAKQDWEAKKRKAEQEAATLANTESETAAREKELPGKMALTRAETDKANSEAAAAREKGGEGTPEQPTDDNLIRMIGTGQMEIGNWGYVLSRMKDPNFARAVTTQYPDMDTSKIKRYMKASDEFASSDKGAGKQLNNGSTAINHLGELYDAASASSMIPYSRDNNITTTLKAGIIGELGQFYGESTIPGQTRFEKGIGSLIPSARKDAILEQIRMLGDKMSSFQQQWRNSMPSARYTRPMPALSPEAMRTWMALDPKGARVFLAHQDAMDMSKNGVAAQPAAAEAGPPQAVIDSAPEGSYIHSPDGKQSFQKVNGKAVPVNQ